VSCSLALLTAPEVADDCELAKCSLLGSAEDIVIAMGTMESNDSVNGASRQVTAARR
jgi:hypothetical protein